MNNLRCCLFSLLFLPVLPCLFSCPARADSSPYRIGVIAPLSGPLAKVGADIQSGITLAQEERSKEARPIEVIYEDNQHRSAPTATATQKLMSRDKVDLLISLWDPAEVVAPLAEKAGLLHISIRWNPNVAAKHQNAFTIESTYKSWSDSELTLLRSLGVQSLAVIRQESEGWNLAADRIREVAKEYGIKLIFDEGFVGEQTDFRSLLLRARAKQPDHVLLLTLNPETALILKQKTDLNWNVPHSGFYEAQEDLTQIEGMPFVAQQDVSPEFRKKFHDRFKENFHSRAPHGYEILRLVSDMLEGEANKPTAARMSEKIMSIKDRPSCLGPLNVSATRNIENKPVWFVVKNGQFTHYQTAPESKKSRD